MHWTASLLFRLWWPFARLVTAVLMWVALCGFVRMTTVHIVGADDVPPLVFVRDWFLDRVLQRAAEALGPSAAAQTPAWAMLGDSSMKPRRIAPSVLTMLPAAARWLPDWFPAALAPLVMAAAELAGRGAPE